MFVLKVLLCFLVTNASVYIGYELWYKFQLPSPTSITYSVERKLIAEISDIAGYHYKRELVINQSWERLLNSCRGLENMPLS